MSFPPNNRQRGFTLLQALLAFLALSLGMLALGRVQTHLRQSGDLARQQSEAVRLAQQEVEALRAFAGPSGYSDIADRTADVTPASSNARFTVARSVRTHAEPSYKAVQVTVSWHDRAGASQQVNLSTIIAGHDPAHVGALTLARPALPRR